mgnify:CR=1 FL=1
MNYRPITDVWILGRSKTKDPETGKSYYGAYPAGFLERARPMLVGGNQDACILHVCGGHARGYNGKKGGITLSGFGKNDLTLDIDPLCRPDILADARELHKVAGFYVGRAFDAILIDRPYSYEDAKHYRCGPDVLPDLNKLLTDCLRLTDGLVGVIDYAWPSAKGAKEVAAIAVGTGRNARARWFTVWKKTKKELAQ